MHLVLFLLTLIPPFTQTNADASPHTGNLVAALRADAAEVAKVHIVACAAYEDRAATGAKGVFGSEKRDIAEIDMAHALTYGHTACLNE